MKRIVISVLAAALIAGGAVWGACGVKSYARSVEAALETAVNASGSERNAEYETALEAWNAARPLFYVWFPHSEVDTLGEHFALMGHYLDAGDEARFFSECRRAIRRLENIGEAERLSVENVF